MGRKPAAQAPREWDRAAIMVQICERIAGGESVREICQGDDMPDRRQVNRWIAVDANLRQQYLDACKARTYFYMEEIIEIADTPRILRREIKHEDGSVSVTETDNVGRSKLQSDDRKWVMARMNRVDFGDELGVKHSGTIELASALEAARKRRRDGNA